MDMKLFRIIAPWCDGDIGNRFSNVRIVIYWLGISLYRIDFWFGVYSINYKQYISSWKKNRSRLLKKLPINYSSYNKKHIWVKIILLFPKLLSYFVIHPSFFTNITRVCKDFCNISGRTLRVTLIVVESELGNRKLNPKQGCL